MGHAIGITRQYDAGALRKLARRVRLAWSVKRCAIGCIALIWKTQPSLFERYGHYYIGRGLNISRKRHHNDLCYTGGTFLALDFQHHFIVHGGPLALQFDRHNLQPPPHP